MLSLSTTINYKGGGGVLLYMGFQVNLFNPLNFSNYITVLCSKIFSCGREESSILEECRVGEVSTLLKEEEKG